MQEKNGNSITHNIIDVSMVLLDNTHSIYMSAQFNGHLLNKSTFLRSQIPILTQFDLLDLY